MDTTKNHQSLDEGLDILEKNIELLQKEIAESDRNILYAQAKLEVLKTIIEKL